MPSEAYIWSPQPTPLITSDTRYLATVTIREKGGFIRAHRHARTLPNPEALGPEIEKGAVNRRPLQALFPLPRGGAGSAAGPGAILLQLRIT